MNIVFLLLSAISMVIIAPALDPLAHLLMIALLATMLGSGRMACRALGTQDDPFMAIILGFVLLSYSLLGVDLVSPGVHWWVPAILGAAGSFGLIKSALAFDWRKLTLALLACLFTASWCFDINGRLAVFHTTARFPFWVDLFVHSGTLARFGSLDAIGRGAPLMADTQAVPYHYASYLPAALFTKLIGVPVLDATILTWLPLGILIMAFGVVALATELGGPILAAVSLAGLALFPDPGRLPLQNGFLDFAWMLEISPGTGYSVGIGCAALACLVRWHRDHQSGDLILGAGLVASCLLVRANTFLWLAPAAFIGLVACWPHRTVRWRAGAVAASIAAMILVLAAISSRTLLADPSRFLFKYVEFVLQSNRPTALDGMYPGLVSRVGRTGAGLVGLGIVMVGTLGFWLPLFLVLGVVAALRRRLDALDMIPVALLVVALVAMVLAPDAGNGDFSEFRHRAGPFLVVVMVIGTLRILQSLVRDAMLMTRARLEVGAASIATVAIALQVSTVSAAKRPAMEWAIPYYDVQTPPELMRLSKLLASGTSRPRRFVVANQPADTRVMDDASRLVSLSGVPAFIATPVAHIVYGGAVAYEARRRMAVVATLADSLSVKMLQARMRSDGITHYVVMESDPVAFDPDRSGAIGQDGRYAVYDDGVRIAPSP